MLGAPWDAAEDGYAYSFHDTATIYDWLFANYSIKPSIDTGSPVTEVKVNYSSEADTLMLYPAGDLKTVLPNDSDELLEKPSMCPKAWTLPLPWGDKVGTVTLTLNGRWSAPWISLQGRTWPGTFFCMRCHACRHSSAGFISVWYVS